jgi:5-formaminoimidazole-4-carboxamide-1-(beta)-D-ribofuranosyl 5'-monophosphate synthetase
MDYVIATIASHSALQILKGARDEGFKTIAICKGGKEKPYKLFDVADEIILVDDFSLESFNAVEIRLKEKNAILIPHGSFVSYLGTERCTQLSTLYYGNKAVLEWESNRVKERVWLEKAGLQLPRQFDSAEEIDCPAIVKFHGALGGRGYFIAKDAADFKAKIAKSVYKNRSYVIQEYIVGVPVYIHYFYSPLTKELEVMSFDRRYETNVDSIGRIHTTDQAQLNVDVSYVVVGNTPLVIRESLLSKVIEMGENIVAASMIINEHGLFGPFCLETILTPNQEFIVFEISARIVAGTNLFINGSPYTDLKYSAPMSTGRRIAVDIKQAIEQNRLHEVLH